MLAGAANKQAVVVVARLQPALEQELSVRESEQEVEAAEGAVQLQPALEPEAEVAPVFLLPVVVAVLLLPVVAAALLLYSRTPSRKPSFLLIYSRNLRKKP